MSKRDKLRGLTKQFPTPTDLAGTFEALREDTDRSVAMVCAAIAENVLERILVQRLERGGPDLLNQLFNNRGPLSDFQSKILIAHAFGVIPINMASELQRVRHIRNVFAHATIPVTFQTPEIAEEMAGFAMLNAMDGVAHPGSERMAPRDKAGYLLTVHLICIMLDHEHRGAGGSPILATHKELAALRIPSSTGSTLPER